MNSTSISHGPTIEAIAKHMIDGDSIQFIVHYLTFNAVVTSIARESEENDFFVFRGTCIDSANPSAPKQSVYGRVKPGSQICTLVIKHIDAESSRRSA
jgi:hypothetical protein